MALLRHPASTGKFVDDRFSALVEPNLFDANVFQPGITFTDKYTLGAAGQIFIHKLGKVTVAVGAPGEDFVNTNTADTTIAIVLNKAFRRSEKIYGATAASVSYPIAAAHLEQALADIRQAWNKEAARIIVTTKINTTNNSVVGPASVLGTTTLSATNVYKSIVDDRSVLVAAGARPDALIVSPATYAFLLQTDEFVTASDLAFGTAVSGELGRVFGMSVFEYQGLPAGLNVNTTGQAVNRDVEYIMLDHDAFSIVTNVELIRLIDDISSNSVLAQIEILSGMALTNTDRALVKVKASA